MPGTKSTKRPVKSKAAAKSKSKVTPKTKAVPKAKAVPKPKPKPAKRLTAKQQQEMRSAAARKAAAARWAGERPPSKLALKRQMARVPTSELTVEHYADRPNPELSWAAAILKRDLSTPEQRREAARIFSYAGGKRESPWSKLTPEQRSEIARRGGVRRWEIWREERARQKGKKT